MTYVNCKDERERLDGCPACGNPECTLEDTDYHGKEYAAYYTCDACGQEFAEVYEHKFTEYTKEVK